MAEVSLQSIEKLHDVAASTECANGRCEKLYRGDLDNLADIIEEEVAERYVELPVDADGVPIRVDDLLRLSNGKVTAVRFITFNDAGWLINESGWLPDRVTHYQPDSWERIIEDAIKVGYADADNERLDGMRGTLVARCRALAGDE